MSGHDLIKFIRLVSRFTIHLCNAIYFSTIFNVPCRRFTNFLDFRILELNKTSVGPIVHFVDHDHELAAGIYFARGGDGESETLKVTERW